MEHQVHEIHWDGIGALKVLRWKEKFAEWYTDSSLDQDKQLQSQIGKFWKCAPNVRHRCINGHQKFMPKDPRSCQAKPNFISMHVTFTVCYMYLWTNLEDVLFLQMSLSVPAWDVSSHSSETSSTIIVYWTEQCKYSDSGLGMNNSGFDHILS